MKSILFFLFLLLLSSFAFAADPAMCLVDTFSKPAPTNYETFWNTTEGTFNQDTVWYTSSPSSMVSNADYKLWYNRTIDLTDNNLTVSLDVNTTFRTTTAQGSFFSLRADGGNDKFFLGIYPPVCATGFYIIYNDNPFCVGTYNNQTAYNLKIVFNSSGVYYLSNNVLLYSNSKLDYIVENIKFQSIGATWNVSVDDAVININGGTCDYSPSSGTFSLATRLTPDIPVSASDLFGYATGSYSNYSTIDFQYIWYKNNVPIYANGNITQNETVGSYTANSEVLLDTLNYNYTSTNDNITWSVRAYNGSDFSDWINETVTILNVSIGGCSDPNFNSSVFGFNYKDVDSGSSIASKLTTNLYVTGFLDNASIIPFFIKGNFSEATNHQFCTNIDPVDGLASFLVSGSLLLTKDEYALNAYDFDISNPFSFTNSDPTNTTLFMSLLNETSTVVFTWRTHTFENVNGIMEIYGCDGSGFRELIASTPIINGEAYGNLELINQLYSYEVISDGVRYIDTGSYSKCHVETQTTRLYILQTGIPTAPITGLYSIPCNVTKTGNFSFTMSWGENPQSDATITGCYEAVRQTVRGATMVANVCSETSPLSATLTDSGFTYLVKGRLYQGGYNIGCDRELVFETAAEQNDTFGITGILAIFFLVVGMILLFSNENPKWYPIMGVIGVIVAWLLGILAFGWIGISSLVAFVVIIVLIARKGREP